MSTFARCEQVAGEILAARLAEPEFRARLEKSSRAWQIEFATLMRQAQAVISIALFNSYPTEEPQAEGEAAAAALACLRERDVVELFGSLPDSVRETDLAIKHLRAISIGLTARTAILWERLAQTARNALNADAQFPDEAHIPVSSEGPDRTEGTLTVERFSPES